MGQEVKYRVWDHFNKKMVTMEDGLELVNGAGDKFHADIFTFPDDCTEHPLMQYTGLKDRDNKEVYVNDFVEYSGHISLITFPDNEFQPIFYNEVLQEYSGLAFLKGYSNFKVVGNLYENPELLEEEY